MFTTSGFVVVVCLWLTGLGLLELFELVAGKSRRERGALERHALGILLGLSFLPALYVLLAVLREGPVPYDTGRLVAYVPAAIGALLYARGAWVRTRSGALQRSVESTLAQWREVGASRTALVLVGGGTALVLFFAAFAVFYAGSLPVHLFDSLYHFAYKGKVLLAEGFGGSGWMVPSDALHLGRLDGQHDAVGRLMTHPNYPPGIPALHCLVGSQLERFSEDATRPLMALYVLGCAAFLWAWLAKRSLGAAVAGSLSWLSLPFLYYSNTWFTFIGINPQKPEAQWLDAWRFEPDHWVRSFVAAWVGRSRDLELTAGAKMPDGWTLDGSADLPQAVLFGVGALLAWRCLRWSAQRCDRADALAAGVLLGGAALVKNEGLALVAIAGAAIGLFWLIGLVRANALAANDRTNARGFVDGLLVFGIAAAIAAPWLAIRGEIPSIDEDYPTAVKVMLGLQEAAPGATPVQPRSIGEGLARIPVVASGFVTSFVHVLRWNLVWVLFIATVLMWLVLRGRRLLGHPVLPLLLTTFGALGAYALILVVTPWELPLLFSTAIPGRIILHVVPLVIFTTIVLMWRRSEEWNGPSPGPQPIDAPVSPAAGATAAPTPTTADQTDTDTDTNAD